MPSASSSSTRAPSRSRTTSLTVRTASSSSSARCPRPCLRPVPRPSLPDCYCDPEASPRREGPSPTETGTRVLGCAGWQGGLKGSHLLSFPLPEPLGLSLLLRLPPGCRLFLLPRGSLQGPAPQTRPARPAPRSWSHLLLLFRQRSRGRAGSPLLGGPIGSLFISVSLRPNHPCSESIGGHCSLQTMPA